ncbi:MAG: glycosyl hydrolase [Acidobacteriia bacterium]|nr:glycosyl hydrolase [Terriglobia bacterium]
MRKLRLTLLISTAAGLCAAAAYDPSIFSALQWRSVGPLRGGRSITSTGSPSRPNEYYFGATGGGLWKTTDGGLTWRPITDGQLHSSSVGAVAVSESNPDVVYVGMGETELRGNIMQGDGVYKSIDAGKTWKHVGLADTQAISRIRIHPTNPDLVYVSALGHPYGKNAERGVFRSKDGGATWEKVLFRNDHAGAVDLSMDPHNPQVLFAAIWDANRTPWGLTSGGPSSGLFKTTDGGDHWTEITRNPGLPQEPKPGVAPAGDASGIIGKIGVAVSGADSNRVYAIVENENGGVFFSDDAGATWKKISEDRNLRQRAFYYSRIYADPKAKDTVFVLNTGFYKSTDGGKTYRQLRPPHGDNHDLWIDPNNPQRMINSNDGGGNVSINGGQTWTGQQYATAQLYHVAVTKDIPYHVCGAQQDSSTICVPSAAAGGRGGGGGGRGAAISYSVGGGESGYIAPHPTNPNLFYAGSQGALLTRFDRRTSYTRDIQVYPLFFSGESAGSLPERWQWTFPIVFSPANPDVLYTSSQHLWKTTDDGHSWQKISPDLTRNDAKTLGDSGGPITHDQNGPEIYGTIFTIAPSRKEADTIWTGSDDGLVYLTRDGGKTWNRITPPGMPDFGRVSLIDASPNNPAAAYVAVKNYQNDDRRPYIFKTADYGSTWTKIVNGIPDNDFVHAVREDPGRPGLLFAGTEHGIYVSFDDGAQWQSISLNLPDTQVSDLVIEGKDLVMATHGRSFYILDDITPLRQLTPTLLTEDLHLFHPPAAERNLGAARIDYYLKQPADKITIDILDAKGQVVRSFTGSAEDDRAAGGRGGRGGRGGATAEGDAGAPAAEGGDEAAGTGGGGGGFGRGGGVAPVPRKAGLNHYQWDQRYPGAKSFAGMIYWSGSTQGPVAVPGTYQVRLTANGKTLTDRFELEKDPRLDNVTIADLAEQFTLAMQVRDKTSEANEMVIEVRELKKQMDDRLKKNQDAALKTVLDSFRAKLTAVEEEVYQVRNRSGQDPLNFPIKLNNKLAALDASIGRGDGKPTAGSYEVFKVLSDLLAVQKARLDAALQTDLPAVDKLLTDRRLDPLIVTTTETKDPAAPGAGPAQ